VSLVWDLLVESLHDRYTLERELGRGAMATVYLARDLREQRSVAVKVMHRALSGAIGRDRFLREIEIASSLSHPQIVQLFESGSAGDVLYYVMQYIEGEALYRRLERERQVPLEESIRITCDVAEALGYAHGRGVLHRDVKPENILLAGGRALVADFGLARAIGAADQEKLTKTGVAIGSIYYMSPEQLRAERDLDERTDIYGLGCSLYEMLTGEPPYAAASIDQVVMRTLRAPVPSVQPLCPAAPGAIDRAITKALAKSAGERFATMREFAAALRLA
jgi:serine/threonine-protein kinase